MNRESHDSDSMSENWIADSKYTYSHEHKSPSQAIDAHHIIVRNNRSKCSFVFLSAFLLANAYYCFFLVKEISVFPLAWSFLLGPLLLNSLKSVKKESVVVIPAFGVQLETHYRSGSITRRFVPISKILKPVLSECVTPVTCYWSLSLIVRDEEELMLVFKVLRPPVKMLVPIWRALCTATNSISEPDMPVDFR